MKKIVQIELEDLETSLKLAAKEGVKLYNEEQKKNKLYSVNQTAKLLGKAHRTIKKMIFSGVLKTTSDGLITQEAINDYLKIE